MIHQELDGYLECDMHPGEGYLKWCEHVADFVSKGRDAELIHPVDGTTVIQVPMLPASLNLYQEVILEPLAVRSTGACVIEFEFKGEAHSAGHVMPGEGRGVMRENLIQWMLAQPGTTGDGCNASLHGWAEKDRLRRMDAPKLYMEQWLMFKENMCTVCYKKFLDIADVIPTGT